MNGKPNLPLNICGKVGRRAIIAPSLLSCDLSRIADEAKNMMDLGADWMHMDIMDGNFVPNLTFGPPVIASLRKSNPDLYIDCHLMVLEPHRWVLPLQVAGANQVTFHIESNLPNNDVTEMIQAIRQANMNVGIVIKPKTTVEVLFPYVHLVDTVLIMTVEPGFSGQFFMPDMVSKVQTLHTKYPDLNIQVDGGISPATVDAVTSAGANIIVAASAIFNQPDNATKKQVIDILRASVEKHHQSL